MANITQQEPIRYQIDDADFSLSGLITIPPEFGLDCTNASVVKGFVVTGAEPDGTARKVGFYVDGTLYKLDPDGSLVVIYSVEEDGNTVPELEEITAVPGFVGKNVGVSIYLYAENAEGAIPSIKIKALAESYSQQTVKEELSSIYVLGAGSQVIKLEASTSVSDGGSAVVEARADGGAWGELASFTGTSASTIQFRATLTASNIGVSSAKLEYASIQYRGGHGIVAGTGTAELVSITDDWHIGIRNCRMTAKHAPLKDSRLKAYVSFRDQPTVVQGEQLGIGNGEMKFFQFANPNGIKYDSVRVYFDGQRVYSGVEVNTEVGRATCLAPDGAVVTADYEYGWTAEVWNEMEFLGTIPTLDHDITEFRYLLPSGDVSKSLCAVKIAMEMTEGHVDLESIGAGTGKMKTYPLAHIVKKRAITVYAGSTPLPASSWALADDAKAIRVAATTGAALTVEYDWISETPAVYQFIAVFGE
jgi:hypothetical protein